MKSIDRVTARSGRPRASADGARCGLDSSSVPASSRSSNTTRLPYATRAVTSPTMTSAAGSCDSVSVVGTSTAIGTLTDTARGHEAERIAAAGVDHRGRLRRLGGQHAEGLGQPLRAPDERDAQRVHAVTPAGAAPRDRRGHDVERGQRRRFAAESLQPPARRDQQRREAEDAACRLTAATPRRAAPSTRRAAPRPR